MKIHDPPMTFKDSGAATNWAKGLAKNQDPYGNGVYRYASEWATQMEQRISNGERLENIAEQASHDADEGISGFMYAYAVQVLSVCWIHGEQLRIWHNLKTQVGTEGEKANESGGVLNPAVLNFRFPDK